MLSETRLDIFLKKYEIKEFIAQLLSCTLGTPKLEFASTIIKTWDLGVAYNKFTHQGNHTSVIILVMH